MRELTEINRKLHGWHGTYRGRFLLLQRKILTKEEFILYEASVSIMDWDFDRPNSNYLGSIDLTQQEIELLLGFAAGFVSTYSKTLYKLGLWEKRNDGRIQVIGFELIKTKLLAELTKQNPLIDVLAYLGKSQTPFVDSQNTIGDLQTVAAKAEVVNPSRSFGKSQTPNAISDVISYKDQHVRYPLTRTLEEYRKIIVEGNYAYLTTDDLKWIDTNVLTSEMEGEA